MTKQEFYAELEEVIEADPGYIKGDETLEDLAGWDSLAVMVFIAMVDEKFDLTIAAEAIGNAKTIEQLLLLLGDKISA